MSGTEINPLNSLKFSPKYSVSLPLLVCRHLVYPCEDPQCHMIEDFTPLLFAVFPLYIYSHVYWLQHTGPVAYWKLIELGSLIPFFLIVRTGILD